MPRLFTGLQLPEPVVDALSHHRGGLRGARWIEPADYHVTLRFLGDVDPETAEEVHAALLRSRPRGPVQVTIEALASFGGDKPRAIIASVAGDRALKELQADHERIARDAGAPPETRTFTPHVTLARLRREATADDVAVYLTRAGMFERLDFTATHVALFSARESTGGGPYLVEATYPLTD